MNKYVFSCQSGKAYYCNSIPGFLQEDSDNIVGSLVRNAFDISNEQNEAWINQINGLQRKLEEGGITGDIIFEYDIIRLGKRIDVILLIKRMVFSLEFKNGAKAFLAQDARQAEDYALDIKNFHKESEDLFVCPILVATEASPYQKEQPLEAYPDGQVFLQRENMDSVIDKVEQVAQKYGGDGVIDFETWFNSPYYPTPTIIAAAIEAYKMHTLTGIAHSEAGQEGVSACKQEIYKIVEYAQKNQKKVVGFVTGVPGAGKTLVGLDVVAKNLGEGKDNLSVYISGNGPLVEVLQAALIKSVDDDQKKRNKNEKRSKKEIQVAVKALIQGSYGFKKDNAKQKIPTAEHVLIFDEAQRVWNKEQMMRKHKDTEMAVSEPYLYYSIMDRHNDWAAMICLVGLGQDIHDGEVGINEWFKCGIEDFTDWEMFYSPEIFSQTEDQNIEINMIKDCPRCHEVEGLHLKTSIRSFRSNKQSEFIDYILNNEPEKAQATFEILNKKYPVFITRDIDKARSWVREQVRGTQRSGVLACSSAQRLKPEGIYVPKDIDVKNWFLAPSDDLRSSNMLEVVASEFKVQGLEVDWAIVCWDADLRRNDDGKSWDHYNFRGTKWNKRHKEEQKRYLLNSYRVLLTRARQGMVIFIPHGVDPEIDATRDSSFYDEIYDYLKECGISELCDRNTLPALANG